MKDRLPNEIVKGKDKTAFEPPQEQWIKNDKIQGLIKDAKKILVDEKIIKPEVMSKKIEAKPAHEAANFDWRYLTSSFLFK